MMKKPKLQKVGEAQQPTSKNFRFEIDDTSIVDKEATGEILNHDSSFFRSSQILRIEQEIDERGKIAENSGNERKSAHEGEDDRIPNRAQIQENEGSKLMEVSEEAVSEPSNEEGGSSNIGARNSQHMQAVDKTQDHNAAGQLLINERSNVTEKEAVSEPSNEEGVSREPEDSSLFQSSQLMHALGLIREPGIEEAITSELMSYESMKGEVRVFSKDSLSIIIDAKSLQLFLRFPDEYSPEDIWKAITSTSNSNIRHEGNCYRLTKEKFLPFIMKRLPKFSSLIFKADNCLESDNLSVEIDISPPLPLAEAFDSDVLEEIKMWKECHENDYN